MVHPLHMPRLIYLLLLVSFIGLFQSCAQPEKTIVVHNDQARLDDQGNIVDAHDGRVIQFGDRYYWYGTAYGQTSGFTPANNYVCYSSPDMEQWTYEGALLPNAPEGVYYRPHVVYHAESGRYILWYNWYPLLWNGQFGVAVSDKPEGPYRILNGDVQMKHSDIGLGDFGLFVDEDSTAYLAYNTIHDHQVSVEKLTPDYQASTLENSGFIAKYCEAGSMFKRKDIYYLLTDFTCCFCGRGSGARVYMADRPMGPFEQRGNINRYPGIPQPFLTDDAFDRFSVAELHVGDSLLVEWDAGALQKVTLELAWNNYRTHCRPDDTTFRHPDQILPAFSFLTEGGESGATIQVDNRYNRLLMTCVWDGPVEANDGLIIRLDSSRFDTKLAEIHAFGAEGEISALKAFQMNKGRPVIVPAQQTHIMELATDSGVKYIWMGDLWGSRPDNVKGHDQQYWSAPLEFRPDGTIERITWTDNWSLTL